MVHAEATHHSIVRCKGMATCRKSRAVRKEAKLAERKSSERRVWSVSPWTLAPKQIKSTIA